MALTGPDPRHPDLRLPPPAPWEPTSAVCEPLRPWGSVAAVDADTARSASPWLLSECCSQQERALSSASHLAEKQRLGAHTAWRGDRAAAGPSEVEQKREMRGPCEVRPGAARKQALPPAHATDEDGRPSQ